MTKLTVCRRCANAADLCEHGRCNAMRAVVACRKIQTTYVPRTPPVIDGVNAARQGTFDYIYSSPTGGLPLAVGVPCTLVPNEPTQQCMTQL